MGHLAVRGESYCSITSGRELHVNCAGAGWRSKTKRYSVGVNGDRKPSIGWISGSGEVIHVGHDLDS